MRHGFVINDVMLVAWTLFLLWRLVPGILKRRKAARREALATGWPALPGKVLGGTVAIADGRWELTLTYDSFEGNHGIELYRHNFLSKDEAEHAQRTLINQNCLVHSNPERPGDTTLLWTEVKTLLAEDPYVPSLVRLGQAGYRWLIGLAVLAVAGLSASATLFGIAMWGTSTCVCETMMVLLLAAPLVTIASMVPLNRMMVVAPREGTLRRLGFVLNGWQRAAMLVALTGMVASLAHFGPAFRALPMDADIPDKVFAGAAGVLAIPAYLLATILAVEGLRRLRPLDDTGGVTSAV
jgi:hypothetical protein